MRMANQGLKVGALLGALLLLGQVSLRAEEDGGKQAEATALCAKCGEVAGGEKCCKPADKCAHCGLHKGAPGCCALPKGAEGKVELCPACGEVKGGEKCCQKDTKKCGGCGLIAGSPGCKEKCGAH